jgi:hypothetical protein
MINQDKWISSIPKINTKFNKSTNQLDHDKWTNTIPQKNVNNTIKKYPLIAVLFVCGLVFVSMVKNETRNLQKEINNLDASIDVIKFNLDQAILDNEVITSPENISLLAKEYLNTELVFYKRSQIKQLNNENEKITEINKINKKKTKDLSVNIKSQIVKKIEEKKTEIRKLQELYSNPKTLPDEIRMKVSKQIKEKKSELKDIYESPRDSLSLKKVGTWSVVQVVKAFLGIPIVPGR